MHEPISKVNDDCEEDQEDEKNCIASYFKPDFSVYYQQTSKTSEGGQGICYQDRGGNNQILRYNDL